jgi:ABC-2 type transport system permease protein
MKALDIALKDVLRSFRSLFAVIFMFVIPLLVTGMFYFMFGSVAENGGFNLPKTKVVVANLDEGGPKFRFRPKDLPNARDAKTMGDLIVQILESDELADLVELSFAPDAASARAAVDSQDAQVALIIPADFSHQFADQDGEAVIEFYQDPTLTMGPAIMRAFLNRFTDGMSGVKIAVNILQDEADSAHYYLAGQVVERYLEISLALSEDLSGDLLAVRAPFSAPQDEPEGDNGFLLSMISRIMGGMMIFYAFFTGASSAESILKEDEEHTLQRLFTTPTSQTTILGGKLLSVFLTVCVQVIVLLLAANLIFGVQWGDWPAVSLMALGIILSASSFGILLNSFLKTTKQGGIIFGGVLTVTGMLGLISVFTMSSPITQRMSETVSLLVPQGWAIRGLMQAMNGEPFTSVLINTLVITALSVVFFIVGVWRFNRRYA